MFKTLEELINTIRQRKNSSNVNTYTNKLLSDKKLSVNKVKEEISELLEENNFKIERSAIRLPEGSLKEIGTFVIDLELHPEVVAKINLELKPEEA